MSHEFDWRNFDEKHSGWILSRTCIGNSLPSKAKRNPPIDRSHKLLGEMPALRTEGPPDILG